LRLKILYGLIVPLVGMLCLTAYPAANGTNMGRCGSSY